MRHLTFCLLALTGFIGIAHANGDVYRYTDEKGQVHFTDRWRPGAELVKSGTGQASRPTPTNNTSTASNNQTAISDRLDAEAAARAVNQDVANKRAEQCKTAKERYDKAIAARRMYKSDEKGNRTYISDAEAEQTRLDARKAMDLACGANRR
ncbi:MAG: DUF4124 domain-containing protein [Pseudomonadales bacterium]|nr:DUF4124 domain-containing protein [Pseudomonadales bacterium]